MWTVVGVLLASLAPLPAQVRLPVQSQTHGFAAGSGGSVSLTGYMKGSGNCPGDAGGWVGYGTLTMTISPDPSAVFNSGGGGSLSGSWSVSGTVSGCGPDLSATISGTLAGTVNTRGYISVQISGNGCVMSGTGFTANSRTEVSGGSGAECLDPSLANNNISFYAGLPGNALGDPTLRGPSGSATNPTGSFAEPVNTATGNFYSSFTDLKVHGRGMDFVFNRYYNSLGIQPGPMGFNWGHSYSGSLARDTVTGAVAIQEPSGGQLTFTPGSGAAYVSRTIGSFDTLVRNGDGSFTLTRKNQTRLVFGATGQLQSVTDRNGNAQRLAYSAAGDLTNITDTASRVCTLAYDANHRLVSLSDSTGRTVRYAYDVNGDLVSVIDPAGGVTKYTYDSNHRMLTCVDALGVTYLQNFYDSSGRVVSQKDALGKATLFAYAAGATTITDANGKTSRHIYDQAYRLKQTVDGSGSSISYTYDPNGLRASVTDSNGHATAFTYDARGNTASTKDAAGNVSSSVYDGADNPTSMITRGGQTKTLTYDSNGNILTLTDPLGGTARNTYDFNGEILTATDPAGNQWQYQYDSAGNRTRTTDGAGRTATMTYDSLGRLTATTDGLGNSTQIQYDVMDRVVSRKNGSGNETRYTYDAVGNLTGVTDANGNTTTYAYDGARHRVSAADPLARQTKYGYDANNNLVSITNARGKTTTFAYDGAIRLLRMTDPLGRSRSFTYDGAGNLTSMTDGNGKINRFTYNSLNGLTGIQYADGSAVSFTYDADENRTSMTDSHGKTAFAYDALNRLISVARFDGNTVGYRYDAAGRRTSLAYPDGNVVHYQYDGANKLTGVQDWNNGKTAYTYDAGGNLAAAALPNGVKVSYSYDSADRLAGVFLFNPDGSLGPSFAYVLDATGNRLGMTTEAGSFQYTYDALSRLTSWTAPSGNTTQYSYDESGNRTASTSAAGTLSYAYDDADEMLTAGSVSFTYDGNGSRLTKTSAGGTTMYSWDAANRLVSVSSPNASVQYDYDGDGNRILESTGGSGIFYIVDPSVAAPIHEDGPDGSIDSVYGISLLAEMGARTAFYLAGDASENTAKAFDSTGAAGATYFYDPWGRLLNPADPLGTHQEHKFAGQTFDAASGLYYMRARYYDPAAAVFLSRDAAGLAGPNTADSGPYLYANNNPLGYFDPTGLVAQQSSAQDATETECRFSLLFTEHCLDWGRIRDAGLDILRSPETSIQQPRIPNTLITQTEMTAGTAALRVPGTIVQGAGEALNNPEASIGFGCLLVRGSCMIGTFPLGKTDQMRRIDAGECQQFGTGCATLSGKLPPPGGSPGCPPNAHACRAD